MIQYQHIGPHLFREDAFREYAYSVDAYGADQPASFIFCCFEAFKDLLCRKGICLCYKANIQNRSLECFNLPDTTSKTFPWKYEKYSSKDNTFLGVILRLLTNDDVEIVKQYLAQNRNVLLLIPNEMLYIYEFNNLQTRIQKIIPLFHALGLDGFIAKFKPHFCNKDKVWWEEVKTPRGRLFISEDSFISDGFFLPGYGMTEENTIRLESLANTFAVQRGANLSVDIIPTFAQWVSHAQMSVSMRIKNHGPQITQADIEIFLSEQVIPFSSCQYRITNLAPLAEIEIPIQFSFSMNGKFLPIKEITACNGTERIPVYIDQKAIEISYSIFDAAVQTMPKDSIDFSELKKECRGTSYESDFSRIETLAEIDPDACLNKFRKITEDILKKIFQRIYPHLSWDNLSSGINEIAKAGVLTPKTIGYCHTIRVICNIASHSLKSSLSLDDVRIISYAFVALLRELFSKKLLDKRV